MKNRDFNTWKKELRGSAPYLLTLAVRSQIDVSPALRLALDKLVQAVTVAGSEDEIKRVAEDIWELPAQDLVVTKGSAADSYAFLPNAAQNYLNRIVEICGSLNREASSPSRDVTHHQAQA